MSIGNKRGDATFPPYRVGDRVKFLFGRHKLGGVIVEDRGLLGYGGKRLYRVEFSIDPGDSWAVELPAEEIEPDDGKS
jgi:hypothetical protein